MAEQQWIFCIISHPAQRLLSQETRKEQKGVFYERHTARIRSCFNRVLCFLRVCCLSIRLSRSVRARACECREYSGLARSYDCVKPGNGVDVAGCSEAGDCSSSLCHSHAHSRQHWPSILFGPSLQQNATALDRSAGRVRVLQEGG